MSDLEDIAAEAKIAIVGSELNDGGDSLSLSNAYYIKGGSGGGNSSQAANPSCDSEDSLNIDVLNALFGHRYTDEDPDYLKTVEMSDIWSRPPCIEDFFVRRARDDRWRHRGGNRGYNHRGAGDRAWRGHRDEFHGDRNRYGNHAGWGGGDYKNRGHSSDRGFHSRREGSSSNSDRPDKRDRSPHR